VSGPALHGAKRLAFNKIATTVDCSLPPGAMLTQVPAMPGATRSHSFTELGSDDGTAFLIWLAMKARKRPQA